MSDTVLSRLAEALSKAAAGNSHASAPAAAVLWTDKERQWAPVLDRVMAAMPQLLALGAYDGGRQTGPAIWLKCAIARTLGAVPPGKVPVIYLPGVSRADLRAIESCPRDLQPLAELQYRGVFWSQSNGKDWTVSAFLTSKAGGLGLDVAQDRLTQAALAKAMEAGVLIERSIDDMKGRQVNGEWLHGLLAPNPTRDLLLWMNDAGSAQKQWGHVRWGVFVDRCRSDFGFDPVSDGALAAAERLAKGEGKWAAVAELYRDSHASYPKVFEWLARLQPPQRGLFDDLSKLEGYPRVNDEQEAALRYALSACSAMPPETARAAVLEAEQAHGARRGWLWARMGKAPLAKALDHLRALAAASARMPAGSQPGQLAQCYREDAWAVDAAALQALGAVSAKADLDAVSAALRALYLPWLQECAERFQEAVKSSGGLHRAPGASALPPAGTCVIFVDGLRYDVASLLAQRMRLMGQVTLDAGWTSMPSVTASGKAWCSPVAHLVAGDKSDSDFEPRIAADGKPLNGHNLRKLLVDQGFQVLDKTETGDPAGRGWTEAGDLDHYGHEHGVRLARDLETQLGQLTERLLELQQAGWKRLRIVTDHGWLLMPGGLPKTELAKHQTETRWGRCAVLKGSAHGTPLTFGWSWCHDVQVAYAPGVSSFKAGDDYAHGGLSLQECLVPTLTVEAAAEATQQVTLRSIQWKGLRCVVEVEPALPGLAVDIRTKAALASTSLAASVKSLESGKASLAVADDEQMGAAAVVVVLDAKGDIIQKAATTVGG